MTQPILCPKCGSEIPGGAPAGLCPKCLVLAGLESRSAANPGSFATQATPPSPAAAPYTIEELAARFSQLEVLELVGRGGMGAVYKARQRELDRLVAVKILPREVSGDPAFAERFTREARALARLSHPHIVAVHDIGRTADGLFYFIMEYVDGVNLRQAIHSGGMNPKEALAIVPQICDALQFAHDEGVVHRDIKPENILIDKRGRVKIADFGLAKLLGQSPGDVSLTGTQQVMGTLRYMAPEQMEGTRDVDHRADIYSLGVVFYELLTGELPIGRFAPPSKKVEIDVRLDEVVLRALEKEPMQRYQHASEVKMEVEAITSGHGMNAPQNSATSDSGHQEANRISPPVGNVSFQNWPATSGLPRMSRMAVIGAAWAPFALFTAIAYFSVYTVQVRPGEEPPGPAWWQMLLAFTLLPLGLAAPFGTTILGGIAVTQIRHSAGRLYGLGLALADVLLFPLLIIDLMIWYVIAVLFREKVMQSYPGLNVFPAEAALIIAALLVIGVVDKLLISGGWRAANAPLPADHQRQTAPLPQSPT
jgi:predicted Ser/Thr protein kinase